MRRLIAFIIFGIGVALLAGCSAAGFAAINQSPELRGVEKGYAWGKVDLKQMPALLTGLKHSGAPLLSLDALAVAGPAPHFPDRCQKCHASITDCALCHLEDAPGGGHPDLLICASCHQPPREAGQGVETWQNVRIDHSSALVADCQACHRDSAPANHFAAQCSSCHTPPADGSEGGWSNVRMDHQAAGLTDCQSCHAQARPNNHFSGQCSLCHNTSAWSGARFSHQGATACQNCHNPPSDHFGNECKLCHNPARAWSKASFSWHKFDMDHGGADGNCSTCHTRNGTNCTSCHEAEDGDDDDHGGDDDHDD